MRHRNCCVLRAARTVALVVAVTLASALEAAPLHAQLGAAGTRAKNSARNAAAKTDAHTRTMQEPTAASQPTGTSKSTRTGTSSTSGAAPTQPPPAPPQVGQDADKSSVAVRGGKDEVGFRREMFGYERHGRRDPFLSLLHSNDLRPMLNDLKLVAVLYDPVGRSWAVLRDITSKEQYRVKVGQQLGRMRVTQIHPKSVTFTIEEIGYSRQQTLALNDSKEKGL
jgi:hypothetical protein